MARTTPTIDRFQQARKRFRWLIQDTLDRLEDASDFTFPDYVLVHSQELWEATEALDIVDLPWIEARTDRPAYTRLTICDPATGFPPDCDPTTGNFLPVYLATPVGNTEPAELARFNKLLRRWLSYLDGLQAPSDTADGQDSEEPSAVVSSPHNGGPELNETERSIIEALEEAGHRMTTDALLMRAIGHVSGHGKNSLASLVRHKVLDNRSDLEPRGYGLLEWK